MQRFSRKIVLLLLAGYPLLFAAFQWQHHHRSQSLIFHQLRTRADFLSRVLAVQRDSLSRMPLDSLQAWQQRFGGFTKDLSAREIASRPPAERPFLQAALKSRRPTEVVRIDDRAYWRIGAKVAADRLQLIFLPWQRVLAGTLPDALSEIEVSLLWPEGKRGTPEALPPSLWQQVFEQEDIWTGELAVQGARRIVAAVPIKDFEFWDVSAAAVVWQRTLHAPKTAPWPAWLPPLVALTWLLALSLALLRREMTHLAIASKATARALHRPVWPWSLLALIVWLAWAAFEWLAARDLAHAARQAHIGLLAAARDYAVPIRLAPELRAELSHLFTVDAIVFWSLWLLAGLLFFATLAIVRNLSRPVHLKTALTGLGFILPSFLHLLIFSFIPIAFAFYISFHIWSILSPEKPFIGLDNYREVFASRDFWNSLKNTSLYVLHVPVGMAVSLMLALIMNRKNLPGLGLFRTLFYLPSITSFVAIAIVWQWIYNPEFGLLNYVLSKMQLGPYPWLNSPKTALLSLMLMAIWLQAGYQMVIYLAGLQNIPEYLYEAAKIDGANRWQLFWRITFPMLKPTTFFILVTSLIGSFQVFTQIYVMTEGGPLKSTDVVVYHIYKNAWDFLRMGYASAMSFVLFFIIMALTLLQFHFMRRREVW